MFSKNESLILFKLDANVVKSRCVFSSNLTLKIVFSNSLQIAVHSLHFFTPLFDCQTDRMSGKLPPRTFLSAYRLLDVISRRGRGHASPDHPRDCHYLRLLAEKFPEVGWNARETKTGEGGGGGGGGRNGGIGKRRNAASLLDGWTDGWMDGCTDEGRVTISEKQKGGGERERRRRRGDEVSYLLVVMTVRMDTSLTGFCLLLSSRFRGVRGI